MKIQLHTFCKTISVLFILSILFLMCDSDTTSTDNTGNPMNVTGSWELSTTVSSNTCGFPNGQTNTEFIYITDTSGVLSIINFDGYWGVAEVNNQTIQFTGSETRNDLGCLATLETEGTGTITETEIVGTFNTTVSFDPDSCPGITDCTMTTDFTMTKIEECNCMDRAVFGDPDSSEYILPYPVGASYSVYQSYCWPAGGHRNQLAYDFTIPIGDTIVAARAGIVREIKESSPDNGQGYGEHNFVYIEHEDGTLAFYAHLMQNSVAVEVGDSIAIGEYFALSGNSGESGEPHLHIGVYKDYPPVEGNDVPVNFRNADGPLDSRGGLIRGETYTALPY